MYSSSDVGPAVISHISVALSERERERKRERERERKSEREEGGFI
jgi:hypothetical protein